MTSLIFDLDNTLYPRSPEVEADFAGRIKNYLKNNLSVDFDHSGFDWEKASLNMGAFLDRIFWEKIKNAANLLIISVMWMSEAFSRIRSWIIISGVSLMINIFLPTAR